MLNAIDGQTRMVFSAGKRLAECLGTFEGIRDQVMVLPLETAGAGAHALNRIQLSLLECLVVQACALFQKPREATDASLHSLSSLLSHAAGRKAVIEKRDGWYPHLDAREDLIDSAKKDVEARIDRFRADLKAYKVGVEIRTIRNKAIAHVTTYNLIEPLIHDVTCVAENALRFVQDAHDIFDGGDSGLSRREIFRKSAHALMAGAMVDG